MKYIGRQTAVWTSGKVATQVSKLRCSFSSDKVCQIAFTTMFSNDSSWISRKLNHCTQFVLKAMAQGYTNDIIMSLSTVASGSNAHMSDSYELNDILSMQTVGFNDYDINKPLTVH